MEETKSTYINYIKKLIRQLEGAFDIHLTREITYLCRSVLEVMEIKFRLAGNYYQEMIRNII